jgi:hypothetical protein
MCGCQLLCINRIPFDPALGLSTPADETLALQSSLLSSGVFFRGKLRYHSSRLGWIAFVCAAVAMVVMYTTALLVPTLAVNISVENESSFNVSLPGYGTLESGTQADFTLRQYTLVSLGSGRDTEMTNYMEWETVNKLLFGCLVLVVPYVGFVLIIVGAVLPLNRMCSSHPSKTCYQRLTYEAATAVCSFVAFDVLILAVLLCVKREQMPTVLSQFHRQDSSFTAPQPDDGSARLTLVAGLVQMENKPLPHVAVAISAVILYWIVEYLYIFLGRRQYRMRVGGTEKRVHSGGAVTWRARKEGELVGLALHLGLLSLSALDMEQARDPWEYEFDWDQHFVHLNKQVASAGTKGATAGNSVSDGAGDGGKVQERSNLGVILE